MGLRSADLRGLTFSLTYSTRATIGVDFFNTLVNVDDGISVSFQVSAVGGAAYGSSQVSEPNYILLTHVLAPSCELCAGGRRI